MDIDNTMLHSDRVIVWLFSISEQAQCKDVCLEKMIRVPVKISDQTSAAVNISAGL